MIMTSQTSRHAMSTTRSPPSYTSSDDIEAVAGTTTRDYTSKAKTIKLPDDVASAAVVRGYIVDVLHPVYEVPHQHAVAAAGNWEGGALGKRFRNMGKREYIAMFGKEHGKKLHEYRKTASSMKRLVEGMTIGKRLLAVLVGGLALWGVASIIMVSLLMQYRYGCTYTGH